MTKPSFYERPNGNKQFFYHSITHPFFSEIYKLFYPIKEKVVNWKILNRIDNFALAVWYQDDGSFNPHKYSRQIFLCTDSYTLEEHKIIQEWFMKQWKIEVKIQFIKGTNTSYGFKKPCYRIRINRFEVLKFINIIRPFTQSCMFHKLPHSLSC